MATQLTNNNSNRLSESQLQHLLNNQEKELELKAQELELHKQTNNNNHDYAKSVLSAQVEDRKLEREVNTRLITLYLIVGMIICILFFVFLAVTIYFKQFQIAEELIKAIVYTGAGAIGGYGYKASKK